MSTDHKAEIEVHWNHEYGHQWRVVCACGYKGEWRMSPRQAERDMWRHDGTDRKLDWRPYEQ